MPQVFVWTVSDVVGLVLVTAIVLGSVIAAFVQWARARLCNHDGGVRETMACDAICKKCGKNLGFIGAWREKQRVPPNVEFRGAPPIGGASPATNS